jgi:hypothetical protein
VRQPWAVEPPVARRREPSDSQFLSSGGHPWWPHSGGQTDPVTRPAPLPRKHCESRILGRVDTDEPHFLLLDDVHQIEHPNKPTVDRWSILVVEPLGDSEDRYIAVTATAGEQVRRELDSVEQSVEYNRVADVAHRIRSQVVNYLAMGGTISYERDDIVTSAAELDASDYRHLRETDLARVAAFDHTMRFAYGLNAAQGNTGVPTVAYWGGRNGELDGTPVLIGMAYQSRERVASLAAVHEFKQSYDTPVGLILTSDTAREGNTVEHLGDGVVQVPYWLYMLLC